MAPFCLGCPTPKVGTGPPARQHTRGRCQLYGTPLDFAEARVALTNDQEARQQVDALTAAGSAQIYVDSAVSGATTRPELDKCLEALQPGDTLVVWKLDRLGRSLAHLLLIVESLKARGVLFRSLTEGLDTNTSGGQMLYSILGAVAQFARDIIRERTVAALEAKKRRGERVCGGHFHLTPAQIGKARTMLDEGDLPKDVARIFNVERTTL